MNYTILNLSIEIILLILIPYQNRVFRGIFSIIFLLILCAEISSYIEIGFFIPAIAIGNLDNFADIGYKAYFIFLLFFIPIIIIAFFMRKKTPKFLSNLAILVFLSLIVFNEFSSSRDFLRILFNSIKENLYLSQFKLNDKEKDEILKNITKDKIIYDSNVGSYIKPHNYNVVLFFVESLSLAPVNKELMPNVYKFLNQSIDVKNYYNHTSATVRGLRGQLGSFYQLSAGANAAGVGVTQLSKDDIKQKFSDENKLINLIKLLKAHNYYTYMQSAQGNDSHFNAFLSTLGFDKLYGMNDYDKRGVSYTTTSLSDKDSFEFLWENLQKVKSPFFYAVYTFATHTKVDSINYKFKDGINPNLNKFYNFDKFFGEFLDKFNHSNLRDNTIIILTADHAHYPDASYNQTFKNSSKAPVDRVVFGIYKFDNKPSIIDVKGLNSLSLAPTICDILGINNGKNTFLGRSIFDKNHTTINKISAIGTNEFYNTSNDDVVRIYNEDKNFKDTLDKIINYEILGG